MKINKEEKEYLLLGGDFNVRASEKGGPIEGLRSEEKESRKSKDKIISKERRTMISKIKERSWMIINGSFEYIEEMGCSIMH